MNEQLFLVERFSNPTVVVTLNEKSFSYKKQKGDAIGMWGSFGRKFGFFDFCPLEDISQERLVGALHNKNEFIVVHIAKPKSVDVVRRLTFRCSTTAKAEKWASAVQRIAAGVDMNGLLIFI